MILTMSSVDACLAADVTWELKRFCISRNAKECCKQNVESRLSVD